MSVQAEKIIVSPKPEIKNTINLSSLKNLKNLVNAAPVEKEKEVKIERNPSDNREIIFNDLFLYWNEFSQKFKDSGHTSQFIIMDREIKVEKDIILLELDNWIQVDQLNDFKAELLEFLRKKLHNFNISIQTTISETITSKKIYTSKEKFQYLAEKYPLLNELKNRLGLDTDF